jgi:hypothetical protein
VVSTYASLSDYLFLARLSNSRILVFRNQGAGIYFLAEESPYTYPFRLPFVSLPSLTPHRIGPEKGVIHLALGAVNNALWDMYARCQKKPLWKLVVDMSPVRFIFGIAVYPYLNFTQEELVRATAWRYISDAITKKEALEMLKSKEAGKVGRETLVRRMGLVVRS